MVTGDPRRVTALGTDTPNTVSCRTRVDAHLQPPVVPASPGLTRPKQHVHLSLLLAGGGRGRHSSYCLSPLTGSGSGEAVQAGVAREVRRDPAERGEREGACG